MRCLVGTLGRSSSGSFLQESLYTEYDMLKRLEERVDRIVGSSRPRRALAWALGACLFWAGFWSALKLQRTLATNVAEPWRWTFFFLDWVCLLPGLWMMHRYRSALFLGWKVRLRLALVGALLLIGPFLITRNVDGLLSIVVICGVGLLFAAVITSPGIGREPDEPLAGTPVSVARIWSCSQSVKRSSRS